MAYRYYIGQVNFTNICFRTTNASF